ncbi:EscU/YscU/HrcU family type III secretion system export apparatus switch protein [Clostridium thermarum]|uniref:EscU/YscU/HrcU family type III secretion system export apparatus switch protein n=1 Tax=Clostridium thermarum TaxID=1716543 RepID=UPI0015D66AD1|nr:EscU/YscU/HrcU family type III secretion system export apparatus switch protein [Clostridium thermarum]
MTKRKKAAALQYEKSYEAPIVTAVGLGFIADNIIEIAKENKVPIVENEELADLLTNVDVGSSIPVDLYEVVAHIIAYVIDLDKVFDSR